MHAVILAGGRGVRLRPYTTALPKPLVPLGDHHVILDVVLGQLSAQGFRTVTLAINHLGELIRAYVGDGSRWGLQVEYVQESVPLSTVGPLFLLRDDLPEHFVVMNGDILTSLRFDTMLDHHRDSGASLTVATSLLQHQLEFGVLDVVGSRIEGFTEKPSMSYPVSMGVYAMSRTTIAHYEPGISYGADQLIRDLIRRGEPPTSYAFDGLWMDIGRPDDYDTANTTFDALLPVLLPPRLATAVA